MPSQATRPAADAHCLYFRPRLGNGGLGGKYPVSLETYYEGRNRACLAHVVWFGYRLDQDGTFLVE